LQNSASLQAHAGFDIGLDGHQQAGYRRVAVALADDVESLQQRNTGFHHGGQLAGEQRDVLFGYRSTAANALLLDFDDLDALAAQHCIDLRLAAGLHFAAHGFARAVLTDPAEGVFLDLGFTSRSGCSCHDEPPNFFDEPIGYDRLFTE